MLHINSNKGSNVFHRRPRGLIQVFFICILVACLIYAFYSNNEMQNAMQFKDLKIHHCQEKYKRLSSKLHVTFDIKDKLEKSLQETLDKYNGMKNEMKSLHQLHKTLTKDNVEQKQVVTDLQEKSDKTQMDYASLKKELQGALAENARLASEYANTRDNIDTMNKLVEQNKELKRIHEKDVTDFQKEGIKFAKLKKVLRAAGMEAINRNHKHVTALKPEERNLLFYYLRGSQPNHETVGEEQIHDSDHGGKASEDKSNSLQNIKNAQDHKQTEQVGENESDDENEDYEEPSVNVVASNSTSNESKSSKNVSTDHADVPEGHDHNNDSRISSDRAVQEKEPKANTNIHSKTDEDQQLVQKKGEKNLTRVEKVEAVTNITEPKVDLVQVRAKMLESIREFKGAKQTDEEIIDDNAGDDGEVVLSEEDKKHSSNHSKNVNNVTSLNDDDEIALRNKRKVGRNDEEPKIKPVGPKPAIVKPLRRDGRGAQKISDPDNLEEDEDELNQDDDGGKRKLDGRFLEDDELDNAQI